MVLPASCSVTAHTELLVTRRPAAASVPRDTAALAATDVSLITADSGRSTTRWPLLTPNSLHLVSVCEQGTFGVGCAQVCRCEGAAACDHVTGRCLCSSGKTGPRCDLGNLYRYTHTTDGVCIWKVFLMIVCLRQTAERTFTGQIVLKPASVRTEPSVTPTTAAAAADKAGSGRHARKVG